MANLMTSTVGSLLAMASWMAPLSVQATLAVGSESQMPLGVPGDAGKLRSF
jgi:hypothetical protein